MHTIPYLLAACCSLHAACCPAGATPRPDRETHTHSSLSRLPSSASSSSSLPSVPFFFNHPTPTHACRSVIPSQRRPHRRSSLVGERIPEEDFTVFHVPSLLSIIIIPSITGPNCSSLFFYSLSRAPKKHTQIVISPAAKVKVTSPHLPFLETRAFRPRTIITRKQTPGGTPHPVLPYTASDDV